MRFGYTKRGQRRVHWSPPKHPDLAETPPPDQQQASMGTRWFRRVSPEAMAAWNYFAGSKVWDRSERDLLRWYQVGYNPSSLPAISLPTRMS